MQQINKVHKKRIEYRTITLNYWNAAAPPIDLFKIDTFYLVENTTFTQFGVTAPEAFITRTFDLNLGDKAQIKKIEIYNFLIETPLGNNPEFNQIILMNSSLFDYGPISIALNRDNAHYALNQLKYQWTPTKQITSLNWVRFSPAKPFDVIDAAPVVE